MRSLSALLIVLSLATPAAAQNSASPAVASQEPAQPAPGPAEKPSPAVLDVDRLPLNLSRIRRELRHAEQLEQHDGLNLRYVIQIYGSAPRLDLFSEDANLVNGPVPYGAPTHRELINHVTPQQFRAPAADFSALLRWLADRKKKQ